MGVRVRWDDGAGFQWVCWEYYVGRLGQGCSLCFARGKGGRLVEWRSFVVVEFSAMSSVRHMSFFSSSQIVAFLSK